jgi:formate dehydrogenase
MASLVARVDGDAVVSLEADADSPMGRHGACGICTASAGARNDPRRLRTPRKRVGAQLVEASWDEALSDIAARIKAARSKGGPRALGLYAGAPAGTNTAAVPRLLATALGWGTPNLYTPLSTRGGPWLRACELVLGHPAALQSDVGRAHYVLLLGANAEAAGWGPMQAGRNLSADLTFSRKTKGTKVIAADARRTALAAGADAHLPVRPGTELFLLLGMIRAILDNNWRDVQYTQDYCSPLEPLVAALAPWTLDRCADACGVPATDIGGVALKFARAAMAVAHRSPQALESAHGTLTAWAILVLHALTANVMRPGGLYDNRGVLDVHPVVRQLPTDGAPLTRGGAYPLHLLQAPGALLTDDILVPGPDQLRALVCLQGDPVREQPGGARLREALSSLDLLVSVDVADNDTTALAHWVLPGAHAWERADTHVHDTAILPVRFLQHTDALVSPPGQARDEADVVADLYRRVGPTLRGGVHGTHLRLVGGLLAGSDLRAHARRLLDGLSGVDAASLAEAPHGWYGGECDRATWRITTADGRLRLLPDSIAADLARLRAPQAPSGFDRWLLTGAARDAALRPFDRAADADDPGVTLHPDAGFAAGARVRIRTEAGSVEATVRLDPSLRPDTVDLPRGYQTDVMALIPHDRLDPFTGTPALNGLPCRVEAA